MNIHAPEPSLTDDDAQASLIGLASLMRQAFSGVDLKPLGTRLIERAANHPDDAHTLMDLSTTLQLTGNRDIALATQAQALALQQLYRLPTARAEVAIRLLAIMAPGDLMANTPLEFLLEDSDVALDILYVVPDVPFPEFVPDHDLLFMAIGESDQNRPLLALMESVVKSWPRPTLNAPERIASLSRNLACGLLGSAPGVDMPISARIARQTLDLIGREDIPITTILKDGHFPIIVRPVGSHAGQGLDRLETPGAIATYLESMPQSEFYVARFVDYRGPDGLFRKYRIVLIDGRPFVCHMGISQHWMIHYLNAGMAECPEKRDEEARFMTSFDVDFARRHATAFRAITERLGLDYVGIDCADTPDGDLLIFEVDSDMIVHAMDSIELFPYKQPQMRKVFAAFREMLAKAAIRSVPC
jgi:hypothetical protein